MDIHNDSPLNIWVETAVSSDLCVKNFSQMQSFLKLWWIFKGLTESGPQLKVQIWDIYFLCYYTRIWVDLMDRDTEQRQNYRPEIYIKLPVCVRSSGWFPLTFLRHRHSSSHYAWGENGFVYMCVDEGLKGMGIKHKKVCQNVKLIIALDARRVTLMPQSSPSAHFYYLFFVCLFRFILFYSYTVLYWCKFSVYVCVCVSCLMFRTWHFDIGKWQ